MLPFINYNGEILPEETPLAAAPNRGLRYGDGIFETMKLIEGDIRLEKYHFERLFSSLEELKFALPRGFTAGYLKEQVTLLANRNVAQNAARIRINCFRKGGGLYNVADHTPDFAIEATPLPAHYLQFNQAGIVVDIYPDARKSCDSFSNIKSNNYLPYSMGALFASQNKLDDALILNARDHICDTTIANVFWVRQNKIYTPPLSEGCIAGVMRRHLLDFLPKKGVDILQKPLTLDELYNADEVFLTNALFGVRWVKMFRDRIYTNDLSQNIYSILA